MARASGPADQYASSPQQEETGKVIARVNSLLIDRDELHPSGRFHAEMDAISYILLLLAAKKGSTDFMPRLPAMSCSPLQ